MTSAGPCTVHTVVCCPTFVWARCPAGRPLGLTSCASHLARLRQAAAEPAFFLGSGPPLAEALVALAKAVLAKAFLGRAFLAEAFFPDTFLTLTRSAAFAGTTSGTEATAGGWGKPLASEDWARDSESQNCCTSVKAGSCQCFERQPRRKASRQDAKHSLR